MSASKVGAYSWNAVLRPPVLTDCSSSLRESRFQPLNGSFAPLASRSSTASAFSPSIAHSAFDDATTTSRRSHDSSKLGDMLTAEDAGTPLMPLRGPSPVKRTRVVSPTPYTDSRQPSFQFPTQYPNTSRSSRSPSPDVSLSQDCAFPPFLPKSRNETPMTPIGVDQAFDSMRSDHHIRDASSNLAPLSPRDNGGNFCRKWQQ